MASDSKCVKHLGKQRSDLAALSTTRTVAIVQVQSDMFSPDDASNGGANEPAMELPSDDELADGDDVSDTASDAGSEVRAVHTRILACGRNKRCMPGSSHGCVSTYALR